MTISTASGIEAAVKITFFSLGAGTDISAEAYPDDALYVVLGGSGHFEPAGTAAAVHTGAALLVRAGTLCGVCTAGGPVYLELRSSQEIVMMNPLLAAGSVFKLADLLAVEPGSIVNMDVLSNDAVKLALMALDAGAALPPHSAPCDALVLALEGQGMIEYEGVRHTIRAGEQFRFAKGALHSVAADGAPFKMALLLARK